MFGHTEPTTGIDPFTNLVAQGMTQEPYASAKRVHWIVDNGSSHHGKKDADRLTAAFPNAVMVHTPVHASWLNQIEIYFSVVQRKVVSPNGGERNVSGGALEQPCGPLQTPHLREVVAAYHLVCGGVWAVRGKRTPQLRTHPE
ncbi:transposase [Streptomyces sp. MS06]|uniref:transposase n=1 Tax=Streptomyces sp. MS06 TaxID=3385974 RepID=UPI00399F6923